MDEWKPVFSSAVRFDFATVQLALQQVPGASETGVVVAWVEAVYVAYLSPECEVVRCYPLALMPGCDPVAAVARDAMSRGAGEQGSRGCCQVLVGPAAELLHIAMTGRLLWDTPAEASPRRGAIARAILAANMDLPGFAEAYAASVSWGDFVMPWYGVTALDERGRLLLDEPEYQERLDVPMTVPV